MGWGTYDVRRHPRVGIVLAGLRAVGIEVVEVNRPNEMSTSQRVEMLRKPWRLVGATWNMLATWSQLIREGRQIRRSQRIDGIIVGYLGHFDVIVARLAFPRATIVLDHLIFAADTARDRGVGGGIMRWILRGLDRGALGSASIILVDTQQHLELLPARRRDRGIVVPVGAPVTWHADPPARGRARKSAPLSVIFFGLFTPLQGAPTIGAALRILAERDVPIAATLVGDGQDAEYTRTALGAANVTWLDWVDADDLPALVGKHDVCLGIFGTSDKAHRVVPNKIYQGAAAGCCLVTSNTAPQRTTLGDAAIFTKPGDAHSLADALEALANDRARVAKMQRASRALAAEQFTPNAVAGDLAARIRLGALS